MSNEFNIDPNVWYQISNDQFDPDVSSLRVGLSHTAIYMFATNLTSTAPTDATPNSTDVCMALGAATDIQRRWILSSNGDGTFDIQLNNTNPLYSGYHLFDSSTNVVAFTRNNTGTGRKWAFQSIMQINDPAFSSGIVATSTTQSATATATSTSASVTSSQTSTASSTSSTPTSSSTATGLASSTNSTSSGLSSGASAGIGVGVALVVLALAAIAFFLFRKRRKQQKKVHELPHDAYQHSSQDHKPPYRDAEYHSHPAELDNQFRAELDHTPSTPQQRHPAELSTERIS
ncbi:hypothetical protein H2200_013165 [Cladophialophora chaetospira]|uniref:Mid2 domain-containing protein n=1 Tax=Cladophialophora chaetospira TaxID=386627 RepID=A0AA38WWA5_9EURO|nr:hypothetical protein H2200_013165 [Cladophialophora chaetospira]